MAKLTAEELAALVRSVFPGTPPDGTLTILVDVPRTAERDNPDWRARRSLALEWRDLLRAAAPALPLAEVRLAAYPDVGSNNADLPETAALVSGPLPETAAGLESSGGSVPMEALFAETAVFLAPTEYSATAPLKNAAKRHGFRAATMPGFSEAMAPALRLDYGEIGRRVGLLKRKLDPAEAARIEFAVDGAARHVMMFDLRFRNAHESAGRFPDPGTAGNLPSGEAYIVPYEGEKPGIPTLTAGTLPVQIESEIVLFAVADNRAVRASGEGPAAAAERDRLRRVPAYGNMAELGFGVLGDFGLAPTGEILLDEKLGLHVAFGRSDHFGGIVGPRDFGSPAEVIHLDRIYIPESQPRIAVRSVVLETPGEAPETIMKDGRYLIF